MCIAHCATLVYRQKSSQLLRLVHRTGVEKYLKWNLTDHHFSIDKQLKANIKILNLCDLVVLEKVHSGKKSSNVLLDGAQIDFDARQSAQVQFSAEGL